MRNNFLRLIWVSCLAAACAGLAASAAQEISDSGPLAGFTRPGTPSDTEQNGVVVPAALNDDVKKNGIGGTVYFQVLERRGEAGDAWGTGLDEFAKTFVPGVAYGEASGGTPESPDLDTSAKYLYLYQVVNDRKTLTPLESASILLDVDLKDISSWGYFAGVGFATQKAAAKEKTEILPVAAGNVLTGDRKSAFYEEKAPPVVLPQLLRLTMVTTRKGEQPDIRLTKGVVQIHWDALDPAINPTNAMLLAKSDFDGNPSFRVIWGKQSLIPAMGRSTVFGFTSNLPPQFEPVRLRGRPVEIKDDKIIPAKINEAGDDKLAQKADGKVPSPKPAVPRETGAGGLTLPPLGGAGGAPPLAAGGPTGGGGGPAGVGGTPGGVAASGGAGAASSGSGRQQAQQQQQQQQPNNGKLQITINNSNQQQQQQRQHQGQHQGQGQHGGVVPQPAALVLAAIGLPFLLLFRRRTAKAEL